MFPLSPVAWDSGLFRSGQIVPDSVVSDPSGGQKLLQKILFLCSFLYGLVRIRAQTMFSSNLTPKCCALTFITYIIIILNIDDDDDDYIY